MIFLSFFIVKKYSSKVKNFNLKKTLKVLNRKKFNFNFFKYLQYTFFFKIFKKIFDVKLKFYKILPFLLGFNKSVCNNLILNFGFTKNSRLYNLSEVEFFFFLKNFLKNLFVKIN